jgi:hypothetical protein
MLLIAHKHIIVPRPVPSTPSAEMPSIITTLDAILPLIPESEPVKAELQAFRDSIFMELPECNRELWIQAQKLIGKLCPWDAMRYEDVRAWQVNVAEAWQRVVRPTTRWVSPEEAAKRRAEIMCPPPSCTDAGTGV